MAPKSWKYPILLGFFVGEWLGAKIFHTTPRQKSFAQFVLFVNMLKPPYRLPYKDDNDDSPYTANPEEEEDLEDEVDESEERAQAEPQNI